MTDGAWPPQLIDHINGNKADNRRKNLRPVTYAENCHNRKRNSNNTSGTTGVRKVENGKFEAYIYVNGKKIHLGYFATKKEAEDARDDAKRKYHPSASWTRIAADAGLSLWKGI
jgi:predicted aspartyl protease